MRLTDKIIIILVSGIVSNITLPAVYTMNRQQSEYWVGALIFLVAFLLVVVGLREPSVQQWLKETRWIEF